MDILNYKCGLKLSMFGCKKPYTTADMLFNDLIAYAYKKLNECKELDFKIGKGGLPYITNGESTITYEEFLTSKGA